MSLIGSLEQLDLANILRRIEIFAKTGLLAVKRQDMWVEFYFRQGQLVCIGPIRTNATLIDRLLQAQILSFQTLPQAMAAINADETNETRIALALINEGFLSRDILRAWSAHETSQVLQAMLAWTTGEIYFEDDCSTPANRLLVALSISTILDTLATATPANAAPQAEPTSTSTLNETAPTRATTALSSGEYLDQLEATQLMVKLPTFSSAPPEATPTALPTTGSFSASQLINAAQLIDAPPTFATQAPADHVEGAGLINLSRLLEDDLPFGTASPSPAEQAPQAAPAMPSFGAELNITASTQSSLILPQPVQHPINPTRIDTSFMTPHLILTPVDLSALREQNPQVQVTPDQWRLFTLIDGQTTLQALCTALMAPVEQVCMIAGELMAIGLVTPLVQPVSGFTGVAPQPTMQTGQFQPAPPLPTWAPQPKMTAPPTPLVVPTPPQTSWGQNHAGAALMAGGGWVISSKPATAQHQPSPVYAQTGGYH